MKMPKKLPLTNLCLLQKCLHDFLSGFNECLLHKKAKEKIFAFLLLLFSISGYSQLANENFEGGIPASWTRFQNSVGTSTWGISPDGYLGGNAAVVHPASENIGAGNTAEYYLVTPSVSVPANGEIRFFTKQGSVAENGTVYQLRLSTSNQPDINGFSVVLQSWTEAELNTISPTAYEEKVVAIPSDIPAGLNIYIAFVAVNEQTGAAASGDSWFVDNVRVIESCLNVANADVSFSNITLNSADVAWTHPSATNFEIQLLPAGTAPGTSGTSVSGFSYSFPSLPGNTDYDVYIKANCPNAYSSNWAGPFSFSTLQYGDTCGTPLVIPNLITPYIATDNLNNYANSSVVMTTPGSGCVTSSYNYTYGGKAFYSYTPSTSGAIKITLTPTEGYTGLFVYDGCTNVGVSCMEGIANSTNEPRIINLQVTAGTNYIILISSNSWGMADMPYTLKVEDTPCPTPFGIEASAILQVSAKLSWSNLGNYATAWEYAVQPAGTGMPAGSGTATVSNANQNITTTLGGASLAAGTNYEVYVRANCGTGFTAWSTPYTFTTQCVPFATPYFENFDAGNSTTPVPCWYSIDKNKDGTAWNYQLEGEPSLYTGDTNGNNNDLFVSPQIDLSGGPKRLRFKYRTTGDNSVFSVVLSSTGVGANEFTTVLLPVNTYSTNWEYVEKIINIPASITGLVNIAWYVSPNTNEAAMRLNIDDVYVEDKPACSDPISPTAQNITTTTAELSWEIGDVETQWEVAIQPLGTGMPTGSGVLVNTNPYQATNLDPSTRYEYYVRAYCSSTQTSNWVGPFNFTTLCTSFPTPFYESFNDADPNTKKFCWSINNANGDEAEWHMNTDYPSIQSAGFFFPTSDYDDWLISPAINAVGAKALKFKYRAAFSIFAPLSRFGVEVLISTTDTNPSSFTVLGPLMEFTNTSFLEKALYFVGNGPVYIAFRVPPQFAVAGGTSILQIDDVIIEDAPACPDPSNLTATNSIQNGASLSWAQGFQEQEWDITVQPMGTGIPTGSGTHVTTNSYAPNTLLPNTEYEFYVRASCGVDKSGWVGPVAFRTLCTAFSTPFVETFNTDSASEDCWRVVNSNNDDTTWNLDVLLNPYEGNQTAAMLTATNGANNDWLISPTINVTANQRLRYYYRVYQSDFAEDLKVKLSVNGIELNQFTTVLYESSTDPVLINNVEYKEKIINLPAGITGSINIAWHIPTEEPSWMGYRGQLLFIDNVVVEDIPACAPPSNLSVQNITDTTVQAGWNANGSETSWEISVQPFGTPAPVGNTLPQYLFTAGTNPYTVTGLTAAKKYQYYVRAICSTTNQSQWVGPFEFTTRCSFENLCEYTITLVSGNSGGVGGGIDLIQNGVTLQTLEFPTGAWNETPEPIDYPVFLCSGVEFSLFWDAIGTAPGQYPNAQIIVKDASGSIVWSSAMGLGTPRTTLYTGIPTCGVITCPQPVNLAVSEQSAFSWTAGGGETQWEVFVQPVGNGTLPQSGTIVNAPSYTPQASDFATATAGTYEYFVRAVCGTNNTSFWSGPKVFVRNDAASNALKLQVNTNEVCNVSGNDITFIGATPSAEAMSCAGINGGDIWFEFNATSKVHIIEANGFTGNFFTSSGDEPYPDMTMTLYKVTPTGLQEMTCSNNNVIVAMYSSELVVGNTYKVRLTLNSTIPSTRKFNVCIKTPQDLCLVNAVNNGFEFPPMQDVSGITTISDQHVVPGWRQNLATWDAIFFWDSLTSSNFDPYSGGQCVQLLSDPEEDWNPNDPDIKGLYKEFDTSEATQMEYSFAHASRSEGNSIQLYAGPPQGPFTLVREEPAVGLAWTLHTGQYNVPAGQPVTRFIFRSKENKIGNILDNANFWVNTKIKTASVTLGCSENSTQVEAEGVGHWTAEASNPATTVLDTPNTKTTAISGFTIPGVYVYHWITRYCDKTITVTYQGVSELPTVTTPVAYCSTETAASLTATAPANHTLLWYTQAIGGTGTVIAPIPDTSAAGTTLYYVSAVDSNGCIGPRASIEVIVNQTINPVVGFVYDAVEYCKNDPDPIIATDPDFTTGGIFRAQPNGLSIDSITGEINLLGSLGGVYTVTYEIQEIGCSNSGSHAVFLTVDDSCVDIPRGISPNNDGFNDTFDLTGLDVKEVLIYNRYGTEVYSYKGDYTNQWNGLSNSGQELPDATYFYSIVKADGTAVTGWVYINRQY